MIKVKCIAKNWDEQYIIKDYTLVTETGEKFNATEKEIRRAMKENKYEFVNMYINEAFRLVVAKENKPVQTPAVTYKDMLKKTCEMLVAAAKQTSVVYYYVEPESMEDFTIMCPDNNTLGKKLINEAIKLDHTLRKMNSPKRAWNVFEEALDIIIKKNTTLYMKFIDYAVVLTSKEESIKAFYDSEDEVLKEGGTDIRSMKYITNSKQF